MDAGNWITIAGLVTGVAAFSAGLWQYANAQRWKRAEFVAIQVKEFEANEAVKHAMLLLDWTNLNIPILPGGGFVFVTDNMLCESLEPHRDHLGGHGPVADQPGHFEGHEFAIRDCFDAFLDGLERFDHFIDAGLVTLAGFRPYLDYWINSRLTAPVDPDESVHTQAFFDVVRRYIEAYQYTGVSRLIERFAVYKKS